MKRRWLLALAGIAISYVLLAYVLLPLLWTHYEHEPASVVVKSATGAMMVGNILMIGGIGVSGAPGGQIDEDCARGGIAKIQDRMK